MKRPFSRGQALVMFALMLPVLFAFAGLAMDVTYAFMVKTALVTATDSAVLAGTRAIPSLGSDPDAVTKAVDRTFHSNLLSGALVSGAPWYTPSPPVVANEANGARSVALLGNAQSPTFFLNVFGIRYFNVKAYSKGSRRDVNVVLVLDRSGSITSAVPNAWPSVRDGAIFFVNQFDDSRDKLALVTFGTSANIDYPGTGIPTTGFQTPAKAMINAMPQSATSNHTNSAWGLYLAYKALKTLNDSTAENVIVYFTDGRSTAFPGNFVVNTSGKPHCATSPREGLFSSQNDNASPYGLFRRDQPAAGTFPSPDHVAFPDCYNSSGTSNPSYYGPDLLTAFPESWTPPLGPAISIYNPAVNASVSPYNIDGPTIGKIGDNMLVNVADTARQDALRVRIFSIGLGGSPGSPARTDVLQRIANVNPYTDATQPVGLYVYSPDQTQLMSAFSEVASSISRLAQ